MKIVHVEAGLRTWNKEQPFPEEINRRIIHSVANLHFAPTQTTKENLIREGFSPKTILVTGNTVIDALLDVASQDYAPESGPLKVIGTDPDRIVEETCFLPENEAAYTLMAQRKNPYGDGTASLQILAALHNYPKGVDIGLTVRGS